MQQSGHFQNSFFLSARGPDIWSACGKPMFALFMTCASTAADRRPDYIVPRLYLASGYKQSLAACPKTPSSLGLSRTRSARGRRVMVESKLFQLRKDSPPKVVPRYCSKGLNSYTVHATCSYFPSKCDHFT